MMDVEYRHMRPDEEDALLDMVAEAMGDDRDERKQVFYDFADDPHRFARTHVAVADDGRLLSAASYWVRYIRGVDGTPRRVGHVFGVATRMDARRQGHAGRLLDRTIAAMRQEGCAWSVLFTREAARSLYRRYGWCDRPLPFRSGAPGANRLSMPIPYVIRRYDPRHEPAGWERLAGVYEAYNATRPLTVVRDLAYWRGYAAWMFTDWLQHDQTMFFVATHTSKDHDLCGYVLAHFYDAEFAREKWGTPPWFFVSEFGVRPEDEAALPVLLSQVVDEAARKGIQWMQGSFPHEPHVDIVLQCLLEHTLQEDVAQGSMMARVISPDFSEHQLDAIFAAPGAISWNCDRY